MSKRFELRRRHEGIDGEILILVFERAGQHRPAFRHARPLADLERPEQRVHRVFGQHFVLELGLIQYLDAVFVDLHDAPAGPAGLEVAFQQRRDAVGEAKAEQDRQQAEALVGNDSAEDEEADNPDAR